VVAAYVVVEIEGTDPERAARHCEMSGPSVDQYGAGGA